MNEKNCKHEEFKISHKYNDDLNEGLVLSVKVEGKTLMLLKGFKEYLQKALEDEQGGDFKINLNKVAEFCIESFLDDIGEIKLTDYEGNEHKLE